MHNPDIAVSVIIAALNSEATLTRQLNALAAQQDAPPFEVIISDNGSTDGTAELARRWAQDSLGAVTSLRVVDASKHKGISFARSAAALHAHGALLAFCDADDAVRPGWVAALAAGVTSGIGGGRTFIDPASGFVTDVELPDGLQQTSYLAFASGGNSAVTREAFFTVGGYDLSYPRYGAEDVELSWRLQEAGYPLHYVRDAELDFVPTPPSQSYAKRFFAGATWIALGARHPKANKLPRSAFTLPWILCKQLATTPLYFFRRRKGNTLQQHLANICETLGRIYGYWVYVVRKKPTKFIIAPGTVPDHG